MRKRRKLKIRRILIIITALLLLLFGAIFLLDEKDKKDEKDNEITIPTDQEEPEEIEGVDEEPVNSEEPEETEDPSQEPGESSGLEPVTENPSNSAEIIVNNPEAIDVLVNRVSNLSETYVPKDLVKVTEVPTVLSNPEVNQLREVAYEALKELFTAAKEEENFVLYARSGYRSYNTQVALYSSYVANHGQEAADTFSAKAGQSEHQTGLAMDITCEAMNYQLDDTFVETEEGKWVAENAHRFGFIIRYPKGKESITGYMYEPWHIRYLGVDLATEVYESGLTLEEYFEVN